MEKLVSYRYLWQSSKKGQLNQTFVKIVTGPMAEHDHFIALLKKDKNITKASRFYICEYDVAKIDIPDTLISEEKETEKGE